MKNLLLLILVALCSCTALTRGTFTRETNTLARITTYPAVVLTNTVTVTNTVTGFVYQTNVVEVLAARQVTNYVTNVLVSVAPAVQTSLASLSALNSAANPTPTAPIINLALGALTAGLGVVAAFKTRRANKSESMLETVIRGVEVIGDQKTKDAISDASMLAGNAHDLDVKVQTLTQ